MVNRIEVWMYKRYLDDINVVVIGDSSKGWSHVYGGERSVRRACSGTGKKIQR